MDKVARPLKTLFLFEDIFYGGTQKQNLELAGRLDRSLFSPTVLSLAGEGDLENLLTKRDVPFAYASPGRSLPTFFFARLGSLLREIKPDILVPCTAIPNIWGRLWGRFLKIPVIVGTCRGGGAPSRQHEKLLWRLADHIVCNSAALVENMRSLGVPGNRLSYVPNGVDGDLFSPPEIRSDSLVISVARLAADKDQKTLIRAFALAAAKNPRLRLRLVGEGPEEKNLRSFADSVLDENSRPRLEFAGASADPAPHYREAAVFALSSVREGQPNSVMEAMSCGLPVCAAAVGGVPDLVGDAGLLSPPKDPVALAENILSLVDDPQRRQKLGELGRKKILENYSFKNMVDSHQRLFLRLWRTRREGENHAAS